MQQWIKLPVHTRCGSNPAVAQKVAQKLDSAKTIVHKKIQPPLSDWIF
jgi:hypothetical protein